MIIDSAKSAGETDTFYDFPRNNFARGSRIDCYISLTLQLNLGIRIIHIRMLDYKNRFCVLVLFRCVNKNILR